MTAKKHYKNTIVQGDDKINFEERPEFGLEKKIEEEQEKKNNQKGYPKVEQVYLPNTVINTNNKEELDTLLQVLECAKWEWRGGKKPTEKIADTFTSKDFKKGLCIKLNKIPFKYITWTRASTASNDNYSTIKPHEYHQQYLNLSPFKLAEIREYFAKKNN